MGELEKIIWTSAFTILGGVTVYVFGQLLSKFFIEPTHELKKVVGEVRFNLAFHAPAIHTPISREPERSAKAHEALLKSSCDLLAKVNAVPLYGAISCLSFGFLPQKKHILEAATQLRGLSTYVHETGANALLHTDVIAKRIARIEQCLGLEPVE
ncbi:MAG: hypothetical protein WBM28_07310 [Burkholderiales bacterium]